MEVVLTKALRRCQGTAASEEILFSIHVVHPFYQLPCFLHLVHDSSNQPHSSAQIDVFALSLSRLAGLFGRLLRLLGAHQGPRS